MSEANIVLVGLLASLYVVTAFTTPGALRSPARTSIRPSRTFLVHKGARRIHALAMVDDDSSVLDDKVSSDTVLSEKFVESVIMPDNTVIEGIVEMDVTAPVLVVQEPDVVKEIVEATMTDPSAVDFIGEGGVVTEIPTNKDQLVVDEMLPLSETVSAVLAASEEAAAAAEAKLSAEEAKLVPLIPKQAQNDTVGVATKLKTPPILPASEVVGEPITAVPSEIDTPDVKKILKFAIPAIGVWLCGPLLSLIDTSAVGLFSGTFQQAALNPAVAVTDYAALLIVSLDCIHFSSC